MFWCGYCLGSSAALNNMVIETVGLWHAVEMLQGRAESARTMHILTLTFFP